MKETITYYQEKYRPQYHFSPEKNWMNDPNGMVYYQGEYHLFYQYHPGSTVWGPMHWGHAVSKDLIHWEHLPVALEPDENGAIFSGSIVVDWNNTSGFFEKGHGLVAIFTHHDTYPGTDRPRERQSLAYSTNRGRTWYKYKGNPVLVDDNLSDFRDPKVFWHAETEEWVMVLVAEDHVRFYGSRNLKDWEYLSSFTGGTTEGVWECPDLFRLPVEGTNEYKWMLEVDINPGGPQGGSGAQYFIGEFDGTSFKNDNPDDYVLWLDYGKDYYAGVSWSDVPETDGRRLWLAWMSNWQYAKVIPTSSWRSAMTIPRSILLKKFPEGIRAVQRPVKEIQMLRGEHKAWQDIIIDQDSRLLAGEKGKCLEIEAEFELASAREFGFKVRKSRNEETIIGYDTERDEIFVDRRKSGRVDFHSGFTGKHSAPLKPEENRIKLHIFVDWSSVELFANDGKITITDLIFPEPDSDGLEIYSRGGTVKLNCLNIYHLDNIWRK